MSSSFLAAASSRATDTPIATAAPPLPVISEAAGSSVSHAAASQSAAGSSASHAAAGSSASHAAAGSSASHAAASQSAAGSSASHAKAGSSSGGAGGPDGPGGPDDDPNDLSAALWDLSTTTTSILDIYGNTWTLYAGALIVTVMPAGANPLSLGADGPKSAPTPEPPVAIACDFGGYTWALCASPGKPGRRLYRLDPRGPGYSDDGMARREAPGDAPLGCVGTYQGDAKSHLTWQLVELPEEPLRLEQPRQGDHVIVALERKEYPFSLEREVAVGADGTVRLTMPRSEPVKDPYLRCGWVRLPGVLPCANHDIAAAVVGDHIYVVGGALWWRGFPAKAHMFDELWRIDARADRDSVDAWQVVAKTPAPIAFAGIAAGPDGKVYVFGGCRAHNGVPNDRSDESQLWVYDPRGTSRAFVAGPRLGTARQECAGATLGGRVYAFGWSRTVESIAPGEAAWRTEEAECPVVMGGGGGMAGQFNGCVLDGVAYFAGPFGLLSFSPEAGWDATLPPSPSKGACPLVAAHDGEVWVISGFFHDPAPGKMCELVTKAYSFDPASKLWTKRPDLPSCEAWGAGASVGGTLFAIGGSKFSRDARTFCFDNRVFALTTRHVEEKKEPWWSVVLQPSKWKLPRLECVQKRKQRGC